MSNQQPPNEQPFSEHQPQEHLADDYLASDYQTDGRAKDSFDSYVILALCVASIAGVAWIWQTFAIARDFELTNLDVLNLIAGLISQLSLAFAMLAAILVVRELITQPKT